MKKYKVNVNGTEYEIAIELLSDDAVPVAPAAPASAPAASAPVSSAPTVGEGEQINSPMPGTILSVNVKVGDKVLTSKYSGTDVKLDGEEYTIVRQSDILAIVE